METRTAILPAGNTKRFDHPWLEAVVAALDDRLRQRQGVFEYSRNPDCLFRIQIINSPEDLLLSDGVTIRRGNGIINLRVWNEQFPRFPHHRPTLGWARRVDRAFDISLRELDAYLAARPDLCDVTAICGNMDFSSRRVSAQLLRYVALFRFRSVAARRMSFRSCSFCCRRKPPDLDDGAGAKRSGASRRHAAARTAPWCSCRAKRCSAATAGRAIARHRSHRTGIQRGSFRPQDFQCRRKFPGRTIGPLPHFPGRVFLAHLSQYGAIAIRMAASVERSLGRRLDRSLE